MGKTSKHKGARPKRKHLRQQKHKDKLFSGLPKPKRGTFFVPQSLLDDAKLNLRMDGDFFTKIGCSGTIIFPRSRASG